MTKERIFDIWTKIVSIMVLVSVFISLIQPLDQEFVSPTIFIFLLILEDILKYAPIFYFGWSKNKDNKVFKMWAKLLTFILPILTFIGISLFISQYNQSPLSGSIGDFPLSQSDDISITSILNLVLSLILFIIVYIPLLYYGWREKRLKTKNY